MGPVADSTRIEETLVPWLQQTLDHMLPLLPPVPGFSDPLPSTDLPPPLYTMDYQPLNGTFDKLKLHNNGANTSSPPQSAPSRKVDQADGQSGEALKPNDWIWATLVKNERVTTEGWWQDVRQIELDIEDKEKSYYAPGSICSLQPRMSAKEVDDFLEMNVWTDQADDVFYLKPANEGQSRPRFVAHQ